MRIPNTAGPEQASTSEGGGPNEAPKTWEATRAQTHFVRDQDAYVTAEQTDIGRPSGENLHELFASGDAGPALEEQFGHLRPQYIAIHDVATSSSRKLIAGIAAASKGSVQKLAIRHQGPGDTLATLEFVELSTAEGGRLRIYSTDADTDAASRPPLARVLLAFSTLGVVLVGDLPGHTIPGTFRPLHEAMLTGPWPNRHLLLLPLSTANALVTQGMELARGTGVNVRTTPQVARPADAWNFISSTWTRLRAESASTRPDAAVRGTPIERPQAVPAAALEETPDHSKFSYPPRGADRAQTGPGGIQQAPDPLPLRPMPTVPARGPDLAALDPITRYVNQLSQLTGMVSCCVFEVATGQALAHAGARPGPVELAVHGAELLASMLETSRSLGMGHTLPEAAITLGSHHLLLRAVPRHPGLALHAVLDKSHANLTLARLQIGRMDATLDPAG